LQQAKGILAGLGTTVGPSASKARSRKTKEQRNTYYYGQKEADYVRRGAGVYRRCTKGTLGKGEEVSSEITATEQRAVLRVNDAREEFASFPVAL
jgi:hypothetical protein